MEWIVKYHLFSPAGRLAVCDAHFDDEDCLSEFCHECPDDIVSVWQVDHYPLAIEDATDRYVPAVVPSKYDREASRADFQNDERLEGVR